MASLIRSINLVVAGGKAVWIKPNRGIIDSKLWHSAYPQIDLIYGDDYFHSAMINMGTMGVVASYMLEVTTKFHLREVRSIIKLDELREKLKDNGIYKFVGAPDYTL
jgi:hypothetical protein